MAIHFHCTRSRTGHLFCLLPRSVGLLFPTSIRKGGKSHVAIDFHLIWNGAPFLPPTQESGIAVPLFNEGGRKEWR